MQIEGAVINEQGVTFALVLVKKRVVDNRIEAEEAIESFSTLFPAMPIVLGAQDYSGRFTFFGRSDISKFLASISPARIPWRRYTFS